ncbi:class I SAM-dependent methyltransferase [Bradyrhizobium sp. STM 3561]|uniref:class I SAM-dependent methyltransferase n=1 Tax=Bradyrhizobium sp. STM 3561 TaxID=578923 RepID=UPI00388D5740
MSEPVSKNCRLCHANDLRPVIDLGLMPIAHRLLHSRDEREERFPFEVLACGACGLPQIVEPIDPDILYRQFNYNFSSWKPEPHQPDELDTIAQFTRHHSVFEIGCNDGLFMGKLRERGAKVLFGVEPNPVSGKIASERGITVYSEMISPALCRDAVAKAGKFDLVIARQVLEHIVDFENFFECVKLALKEDGLLFIDVPDFAPGSSVGDLSVLWEEHVSYFTEATLLALLARHGFETVSMKKYNFSGGTLAVAARRKQGEIAAPTPSPGVGEKFAQLAREYGARLRPALAKFRARGTQVAIYGAGCRACTFTNAHELADLIDLSVDDQTERQGLFLPGTRIPIRSPEELRDRTEPLICLLAVNQENETKVSTRLREALKRPLNIVSVFAPSDIWRELDRLEAAAAG